MKKIKVLFALILIGCNAISQTDSLKKLKYIGFDFHANVNGNLGLSQADFRNISKDENIYVNRDLSKYTRQTQSAVNLSVGINVTAGFSLLKKRPNSITRFSLGYDSYNLASSYYYTDSITYLKYIASNSPTYNSFYIVDRKTTNYGFHSEIKTISFSTAQLFSTNRNKYLSVYTGLSFSGNFSLSSEIQGGYSTRVEAATMDSASEYLSTLNLTSGLRTYKAEGTATKAKAFGIITIGLPLGAELRFSKTRKRLKHLAFAIEFISQVNYIVTPKIGKQAYFSVRTTPFNLIYRF
jgi:hypothetical protein